MSDPVLEIPFAGGIDESTREELASPGGSWTTLKNIRQNKRGGAEKRKGYGSLALTRLDATSRSAGYRCFSHGKQLCTIDGTYVDVYSETVARSIVKSRVPEATVRLVDIPSMGSATTVEDVDVVNGYTLVSYLSYVTTTTVNQYVVVQDAATGTVIRGPDLVDLATGLSAIPATRLASYGNYAIAFLADPTGGNVRAKYLDTTSATTINNGWQTLATFAAYASSGAFDAAGVASNDRVAIAYGHSAGGTDRLRVKTLNISGEIETVDVATSSSNVSEVSIAEDADVLWVAFAQSTNVRVIGLNPTDIDGTALATAVTPFTVGGVAFDVHICARASAQTAAVFCTSSDAAGFYLLTSQGIKITAGAAATDGVKNDLGNAMMTSKPVLRGGRIYALMTSRNQDDPVFCDVTPNTSSDALVTYCRPVAVPIQRGLFGNSLGRRCRTAAVSSTKYVNGAHIIVGGTIIPACTLAEYDFASAYRWRKADVGGQTYLSGGVLSMFDGARCFEAGFLSAPPTPTTDNSTGTGLSMTNGRKYVAVYVETDSLGNRHISGVSTPSTISGAQTDKACVVSIQPLSITARGSPEGTATGNYGGTSLRIDLYATLDSANGEEPYYLITRSDPIANNPNAAAMTHSDTIADGVLATHAYLYGTGALPATGAGQDHRAPPGLLYVVSYNGMLVGANGSSIFYSSQPIDHEGQWFSPLFSQAIDAEITGLAVQDGAVVAFTRDGAWLGSGDPPSDNAATGGLSTFRKMSVDFGCINANSILTTSEGTFYQSDRGIEILTRAQTNTYVGAPIQDTLASYPVVTSAVLDVKEGLARFSLTTAQTDGLAAADGVDVVFDMALGVWISVDDKRGGTATQASQDACMAYLDGAWRYTWLATDGTVYYEKDADYLDGSSWVTMQAISPWIHIAGIHGEQFLDQVLLLLERHTGHDLTISIAFDYVDSYTSTRTFSAANIAALTREWLVKEVGQTTSTAIRVKIEDATPSSGSVGTGRGATWIVMSPAGQPHRAPKRSSPAQRGGT